MSLNLCFKRPDEGMHECSFDDWNRQQHCEYSVRARGDGRCIELRYDKFCSCFKAADNTQRTAPCKEEDLPNTSSGVSEGQMVVPFVKDYKPGEIIYKERFHTENLGCIKPGSIVELETNKAVWHDSYLTAHEIPARQAEMNKLMSERARLFALEIDRKMMEVMLSPQIISYRMNPDGTIDPITQEEWFEGKEFTDEVDLSDRSRLSKVSVGKPPRWE